MIPFLTYQIIPVIFVLNEVVSRTTNSSIKLLQNMKLGRWQFGEVVCGVKSVLERHELPSPHNATCTEGQDVQ
jgi:hypothetical protein